MTTRHVLGVALVVLVTGCGGQEAPAGPPAPEPHVVAADPEADAPSAAAEAQPVLTLDATAGVPVRARLRYYDLWTYVEVCVQEIEAATAEQTATVRYTVRLCAEDGRTEAVALGWSEEEGRKTLLTDSLYETARVAKSDLYFSCPYGTAWEVDATVERVVGERVRFAIVGKHLPCTK